jgi:hypothetical protein
MDATSEVVHDAAWVRAGAAERIAAELATWAGVEIDRSEEGETAFKLGARELGHLHGDGVAHFSFPKSTWRELHDRGRITHHPVFPGQEGPGARRILTESDERDVVLLFRSIYDRIVARLGVPGERDSTAA